MDYGYVDSTYLVHRDSMLMLPADPPTEPSGRMYWPSGEVKSMERNLV